MFFYVLMPPAVVAFLEHWGLDDANEPSTKHLEILEGSFVREARSLCIFAVEAPMHVF
jgi:hypothetical protein